MSIVATTSKLANVATKNFSDIFHNIGALKYFAAGSAATGISSFVSGSTESLQEFSQNDPNKMEKLGSRAGEVLGLGVDFGVNMGFLLQASSMTGGKQIGKQVLQTDPIRRVMGAATSPWNLNRSLGGRLKPWGWKMNVGLIAAQALLPMAFSSIGGFAGRLMDEAHGMHHRSKNLQYDSRYFNTQRYEGGSFDAIGAAYQGLAKVQMNTARIYHNRG